MVSKDKEGTEAGESPREEQRQTRSPVRSRERLGLFGLLSDITEIDRELEFLFGEKFVSNSQCFCPSFWSFGNYRCCYQV